jgi:hypothetical protein
VNQEKYNMADAIDNESSGGYLYNNGSSNNHINHTTYAIVEENYAIEPVTMMTNCNAGLDDDYYIDTSEG